MSRRLAAALVVTVAVVAALPLFVAGWRAADDAERLAERARLDLSMLAATQADHILGEAFFEIELMSTPLLDGATAQDGCLSAVDDFGPMLDGANFSRALFVLDCDGKVVAAEPPDAADRLDRDAARQLFDAAAGATDRYVSDSFILHSAGHAMGGLGLPLYGPDEIRLGTLVSLIDLEQHFSDELSGLAQRLGPTGHADLIGHDGMVLTSTVHELIATSGRHVDFYRDAVAAKRTSIQRVPHMVGDLAGDQPKMHVMAYSPLHGAPWGLAIGSSEGETFAVADEGRRTVVRLGAAALAAIVAGAMLAGAISGTR